MYSKSPTLRTVSLPPFLPLVPWSPPPPPPPPLLSLPPPQADTPTVSASSAAATSADHVFVLMFVLSDRLQGYGSGESPAGPRVQCVLQAVAEQVERQHCGEQGQAGEEHVPPRGVEDRGG